jgi:hypothetical protein
LNRSESRPDRLAPTTLVSTFQRDWGVRLSPEASAGYRVAHQTKSQPGRHRTHRRADEVKKESGPVVERCLSLSHRGLNARKLALVVKQYKFLKKQVRQALPSEVLPLALSPV